MTLKTGIKRTIGIILSTHFIPAIFMIAEDLTFARAYLAGWIINVALFLLWEFIQLLCWCFDI